MSPEPGARPAVEAASPPPAVLAVANAVFRTLLRSPAHGLVDGAFLLLHVTGRKSGRRYDIVVARHDADGGVLVMTSAPWRMNVAGGAEVEVTGRGVTRRGSAELVGDPDEVAGLYLGELERLGLKQGRRLGIRINVPRMPTHVELVEAVRRDDLSVVRVRFA